jgi:hypothetical protein
MKSETFDWPNYHHMTISCCLWNRGKDHMAPKLWFLKINIFLATVDVMESESCLLTECEKTAPFLLTQIHQMDPTTQQRSYPSRQASSMAILLSHRNNIFYLTECMMERHNKMWHDSNACIMQQAKKGYHIEEWGSSQTYFTFHEITCLIPALFFLF